MIVRAVEDVTRVEMQLTRVGVDVRDRPRDQDLGAEPSRLPKRAAGELVTGHAVREAEVVLDLGRRAGLAAGRLALDDERAEPFGGAVHRGGEPRRPRPDDDDVVLRRLRLGGEVEELRDPTELRLHDRPVVEREHVGDLPEVRAHDDPGLEDANGRELVSGRKGSPHCSTASSASGVIQS